jgi:uncharacterized protein with HEPN domain
VTDDRIRITKLKECIGNIIEYTSQGKDVFLKDTKTQDAVLRNLQVIGQIIKDLSAEIKSEYPADWKDAARFRDKITHDYFAIDLEIVWNVIENKIPQLQRTIAKIQKDKTAVWEKQKESKLQQLLEHEKRHDQS